jgi:hypothetical protein
MGNVVMFNLMTVDGFFEGTNHDISWHNVGAEYGLCDSSLPGWSARFLQRFLSRLPVAVREDVRSIVLSCNSPALQVVCHHYGAEIDHLQS